MKTFDTSQTVDHQQFKQDKNPNPAIKDHFPTKKRPDDTMQEKPKPVIMIIGPPFMRAASNSHQLRTNRPTNNPVREPNQC
jgi:hypothetical protein